MAPLKKCGLGDASLEWLYAGLAVAVDAAAVLTTGAGLSGKPAIAADSTTRQGAVRRQLKTPAILAGLHCRSAPNSGVRQICRRHCATGRFLPQHKQ